MNRVGIVNDLIGKPYRLGAGGPDVFDCYSLTRFLQSALYGREMPGFEMPAMAGRFAIAAAIFVHPERGRWIETGKPVDGAIVTMARHEQGYHMGTYVDLDGGLVVHAIEDVGVSADTIEGLKAIGWRKFMFHVPG